MSITRELQKKWFCLEENTLKLLSVSPGIKVMYIFTVCMCMHMYDVYNVFIITHEGIQLNS